MQQPTQILAGAQFLLTTVESMDAVAALLAYVTAWGVATTLCWRRCRRSERLLVLPLFAAVRIRRAAGEPRPRPLASRLVNALSLAGFIASLAMFYYVTAHSFAARSPAFVPIIPGVTIGLELVAEIALAVFTALAVHEAMHALAARLNGVPLKSFGLGLALGFIPVAFVELEERLLYGVRRSQRLGILSAGVTGNLALAAAALAVTMLLPVQPVIVHVEEGSPAEKAGLEPGMVIVSVNGTHVRSAAEVAALLAGSQTAELLVVKNGKTATVVVSKDGEERYGIAIADAVTVLADLGVEASIAAARLVTLIAGINLALAVINAAPLFVTDGARIVWEVAPKHVALGLNVVSLILLIGALKIG